VLLFAHRLYFLVDVNDAQGTIGLHFQCNTADDVGTNFWSRNITNELNDADETIRQNQGRFARSADNVFDQEANRVDFKNTNMPSSPISYYYAPPDVPYRPVYVTINGVSATSSVNNSDVLRPEGNCNSRRLPIGTYPDEVKRLQLEGQLQNEKLAYAAQRYLFGQLLDGGSTDEVLTEIMDAWPQDAWDLRVYLLSKSPYLSVDALKQAMEKPGFPEAMKAEICIANPEATRTEGFLKWLELECTQPVSVTLIDAIIASWYSKTFRSVLEANMAHHHGEMTQAGMQLVEYFGLDEEQEHLEEVRAVWQQIRTTAGRYAEAIALMQVGDYINARVVVELIPEEHALKSKEQSERLRMLGLIDLLESVHADGRDDGELSPAEQAQLLTLVNEQYDRPATWAMNLLCFHYGICRAPLTGGSEDEGPKARKLPNQAAAEKVIFSLAPNPARNWTSVKFQAFDGEGEVLLRDALGRIVLRQRVVANGLDQVFDLRGLGAGQYTVELHRNGLTLDAQKLSVE